MTKVFSQNFIYVTGKYEGLSVNNGFVAACVNTKAEIIIVYDAILEYSD
jgi:hypothetical protein